MFSSWCPELDVASQGETVDQAFENLKDSVNLCMQDEEVRVQMLKEVGELFGEKPEIFLFEVKASK